MAHQSRRWGILLTVLVLTTPAWPGQPTGVGCPAVAVCFTPGENGTQTIVTDLGGSQADHSGPGLQLHHCADRTSAARRPHAGSTGTGHFG